MRKNNLSKGMKFMIGAIFLALTGPIVLSVGFRAIKDGNYLFISLGSLMCFTAVLLGFYGIKFLLKGLFNDEE